MTQECDQPSETCEKSYDPADSAYECMECHQAVYITRYLLKHLLTRRYRGKIRFTPLKKALTCLHDQRLMHVSEVSGRLDKHPLVEPDEDTQVLLNALPWPALAWECSRRLKQEEIDLKNCMPPGEHNPPRMPRQPLTPPAPVLPSPPTSAHSSPVRSSRRSIDIPERARSWPPRRKEQTELDGLTAQELATLLRETQTSEGVVDQPSDEQAHLEESSHEALDELSDLSASVLERPVSRMGLRPAPQKEVDEFDEFDEWEYWGDEENERGRSQSKYEKPKRSKHPRRPPQYKLPPQTFDIVEAPRDAESLTPSSTGASARSEEEIKSANEDITLVIETLKELARLLKLSNFTWTVDSMDKAAELLYKRRKENETRGQAVQAADARLQVLIDQLTPDHLQQVLKAMFDTADHLRTTLKENKAYAEVQKANQERTDHWLNVLFTVGEAFQDMLAERSTLKDTLDNYALALNDTLKGYAVEQLKTLQNVNLGQTFEKALLDDRNIQQQWFREQSLNTIRDLGNEFAQRLVEREGECENPPMQIPIPTATSSANAPETIAREEALKMVRDVGNGIATRLAGRRHSIQIPIPTAAANEQDTFTRDEILDMVCEVGNGIAAQIAAQPENQAGYEAPPIETSVPTTPSVSSVADDFYVPEPTPRQPKTTALTPPPRDAPSPPPGSPEFHFPTFISPGQILDYLYYVFLALHNHTKVFLVALFFWATTHAYFDVSLIFQFLPWILLGLGSATPRGVLWFLQKCAFLLLIGFGAWKGFEIIGWLRGLLDGGEQGSSSGQRTPPERRTHPGQSNSIGQGNPAGQRTQPEKRSQPLLRRSPQPTNQPLRKARVVTTPPQQNSSAEQRPCSQPERRTQPQSQQPAQPKPSNPVGHSNSTSPRNPPSGQKTPLNPRVSPEPEDDPQPHPQSQPLPPHRNLVRGQYRCAPTYPNEQNQPCKDIPLPSQLIDFDACRIPPETGETQDERQERLEKGKIALEKLIRAFQVENGEWEGGDDWWDVK